jgi:hypothetical protein
MVLAPGRPATEVALLSLSEGAERQGWRIVEGTDLGARRRAESPAPAVVSRSLARALGLGPGSAVPLRVLISGAASAVPIVTFTVVGVAEFQFEGNGAEALATTFDAFQRARASMSSDTADLILVASRPPIEAPATVAAISARRQDVHAFSNEQIGSASARTDSLLPSDLLRARRSPSVRLPLVTACSRYR